jgi:microcystin-dependent protein
LRVGINTEAPEQALDVIGNIQSSGSLTVNDTTQSTTINNGALQVRGGAGIRQNLNVGGETKLSSLLTTNSIVPDDNNIRDLGSSTRYYRNTYSTNFIGTLDGTVNGKVNGPSTSSANLINKTTFVMTGDVATVVPIEFDGAYQDPQFDNGSTTDENGVTTTLPPGETPLTKTLRTEISNQFISKKPRESDVSNADLILFDDVNGSSPGLKSVTKENFLKTIPRTPAGVLMPYGGDVAPNDDWILCDGRELDKTDYQDLFQVIGYKFKPESQVGNNNFAVPDLRGRMPMGADNMGGQSANTVTATSADIVGALDGSETKVIDVTNLPEHQHNLQDQDSNQFYATQDRQDPSSDSNVTGIDGPTATNGGQKLSNSGDVISQNPVGQDFNIMPPTVTMNYIIYSGRG